MDTKRLIPYSVHLPSDVYKKLKEAAGERKASSLVRDAITIILEGDDEFNGGYNKALRDIIVLLNEDKWCSTVGINGESFADYIHKLIQPMMVSQNVNKKTNKKTRG
jgi:hypothetical protein